MSVNFVTLGLYFSLSVLPFVATGQVIPALIISAIFVSFLVFSYARLISVMPRAGGDYVWQSRLLTPGIGFVLTVTGWWFILWYWTPIYANILSIEVLQPIAAVFKNPAAITWLASDTGVFVVCVAVTILAGAMVALGMKGYARSRRCPATSAGGTMKPLLLTDLFTCRLAGDDGRCTVAFGLPGASTLASRERQRPADLAAPAGLC